MRQQEIRMLAYKIFAPDSPLWGRNPRALAAQWRLLCIVFGKKQPQNNAGDSTGSNQPVLTEQTVSDMVWEGCPNDQE
jgi:hypothetical protein